MDSNPYFNDELFGFRQKQGLKRTIVSVWEILLNSHLLVTINEKRTKKWRNKRRFQKNFQ